MYSDNVTLRAVESRTAATAAPDALRLRDFIFHDANLAHYRDHLLQGIALVQKSVAAADKPFSGILPSELAEQFRSIDLDRPLANLDETLAEVGTLYLRHAVYFHHPHYVAHLNCPIVIPAILAELVLSSINSSVDTWDQSAGGTLIEQKLLDWTAERIGLGERADGIFTSGGTQSNLMAMLLARDRCAGLGHDVKTRGLPDDYRKLRVFTSETSHFSVQKAAAILGLGYDAVVQVPCDRYFRMDASALAEALDRADADGLTPMAVVATAGTTDFGSIDPLAEIAVLCRRRGVWLHVDAAYGCGLLVSGKFRHLLAGIEQADSVTVDYHKSFLLEYNKLTLEMTSPEYVDYFYGLPAERRERLVGQQKNLYKGINGALINDIYDLLYAKRLSQPIQVNLWTHADLQAAAYDPDAQRFELQFLHDEQNVRYRHATEGLVLATGYGHQMPAFVDGIAERIQWDGRRAFSDQPQFQHRPARQRDFRAKHRLEHARLRHAGSRHGVLPKLQHHPRDDRRRTLSDRTQHCVPAVRGSGRYGRRTRRRGGYPMSPAVKFALSAMIAVSVVSDSMLLPFYPQYFLTAFGDGDPRQVGYYLAAVCGVVMAAFPLWAAAAKKVSVRRLLIYTQFAAGVLSILCYSAATLRGFWLISLTMMAFKASYLLIYPHILALEDKDKHSGTIGVLSVIVHLGAIAGAAAGGLVLEWLDAREAFLLMAIGDFLQMAVCALLPGKPASSPKANTGGVHER